MNLSNKTISKLVPYVVGDNYNPYRTASQLIELFNEYGDYDFLPSKGLPMMPNSYLKYSRRTFAEQKMAEMNGTDGLRRLIEYVLNQIEPPKDVNEVNNILLLDGYSVSKEGDKLSIIGGVINKTKDVKNLAHFENLEKQVLDAINEAKVSICVAMAWFTNEKIKDKLVAKKQSGVDIDIVIYDDGINKKKGVDLSSLPHTSIKGSRNGIMHDKFCVIDNQVVVCGSYNWTTSAETRNDEFVTILKDPESATKFSLEFKKLKNN